MSNTEEKVGLVSTSVATEGKSDIEKLKATETWLYLGDVAEQFVQDKHIQAVVNDPSRVLHKNWDAP